MKTKKQLLHRMRQIISKNWHTEDTYNKLSDDIVENLKKSGISLYECDVVVDSFKMAKEIYELLKVYEEQYGRLPE